eukprot:13942267-Ditylum_brightwellii.AAC.1
MEEDVDMTSNDPAVSWKDHIGIKEDFLTAPKYRGLFKQDDDKIMDFVGSDPDAFVNSHKKGPAWIGKFRPSCTKQIQKMEQ